MTTTATDLYLSTDRKVAADATAGGNVKVANAFGLPAGRAYSCPGATSICDGVCYAGKIEKQYSAVFARLNDNLELLRSQDIDGKRALLRIMLWQFLAQCERKNVEKKFRIHWDGDFFDSEYAQAWADVIREFPEIQFWVYTRSFVPALNVVPIIAGIPNLAVYLSVDSENQEFAADILAQFPDVLPATLAETMEDAAVINRELTGKPGAKCPELIGAIPLIEKGGKGACVACGLCPFGKAPIRFASKKSGRK